jgi:hypothetical protein
MNWTDDFFAGRSLEYRSEAVSEFLGSAQDAGTYPRDPYSNGNAKARFDFGRCQSMIPFTNLMCSLVPAGTRVDIWQDVGVVDAMAVIKLTIM